MAVRRGKEITAEYVLDGLSVWPGGAALRAAPPGPRRRPGRYDVPLLVSALDCLVRCRIEPTLRVMRQPRERGVQAVSVREPWTNASGGWASC